MGRRLLFLPGEVCESAGGGEAKPARAATGSGDTVWGLQKSAEMYAGCVSGAIQKEEYLSIIQQTGFSAITIQKEKRITLPDDILKDYLSADQIQEFKSGKTGIFSIPVYAEKPENCCAPGCCD